MNSNPSTTTKTCKALIKPDYFHLNIYLCLIFTLLAGYHISWQLKLVPLHYSHYKLQPILQAYLVFSLVNVRHSGMTKEDIVSNYVRFSSRVSSRAECMEEDWASAWCLETDIIALNCESVRLVKCDPMLHPVTKFLEACLSKHSKVIAANNYMYSQILHLQLARERPNLMETD